MPLSSEQAGLVLRMARSLIGTPYSKLDCSRFVWQAYRDAGLEFPYRDTRTFSELTGGEKYFEIVPGDDRQSADVIVFAGHMGIWDPVGCTVMVKSPECDRLGGNAPFLSSRTGRNLGPEFGRTAWWGHSYEIYRWARSAHRKT